MPNNLAIFNVLVVMLLVVMLAVVGALFYFTATLRRMLDQATIVASNLVIADKRAETSQALATEERGRVTNTVNRIEAAQEVVKTNLADAVQRADATHGVEGAAADAALRSPEHQEQVTPFGVSPGVQN